jgi:hypothetical protein
MADALVGWPTPVERRGVLYRVRLRTLPEWAESRAEERPRGAFRQGSVMATVERAGKQAG